MKNVFLSHSVQSVIHIHLYLVIWCMVLRYCWVVLLFIASGTNLGIEQSWVKYKLLKKSKLSECAECFYCHKVELSRAYIYQYVSPQFPSEHLKCTTLIVSTGMNAAVRATVRVGMYTGAKVYFVHEVNNFCSGFPCHANPDPTYSVPLFIQYLIV